MAKTIKYLLLGFLVSASVACVPEESDGEKGSVLAQAFDKTLYLSELEGMIPEGTSSEDSSLIIKAYVERWLRDAVMMHEAERNIPQNLNVDKLVRDYRASLVRLNYEKVLMEQKLDSTITQQELMAFYDKNKEQYQLEAPILRCRFIKIERQKNGVNQLQQWWNSGQQEDLDKMLEYCQREATIQQLQDSSWFKVEDIAAYMPPELLTVDNVGSRKDFIQREDDFIYFFKVLELVSKTEIAPFSYIKDQASKVILHRRKTRVLEDMKKRMYEEALRKKNIKIF